VGNKTNVYTLIYIPCKVILPKKDGHPAICNMNEPGEHDDDLNQKQKDKCSMIPLHLFVCLLETASHI
jgi:hypothetical protein